MQQNIDSFAYFHSTINSKWKVLRFLLFSSSFSISLSHSSNDQNCSVVLKSIRHNRLFCLIQLKQIQMKSVTKSAVYSKQKPKKKHKKRDENVYIGPLNIWIVFDVVCLLLLWAVISPNGLTVSPSKLTFRFV